MAKITDLAQILEKSSLQAAVHEVVLFDGSVIHLMKPSQAMVVELLGMEQGLENRTTAEMVAMYNSLLLRILNHNREGKAFTPAYLEEHFTCFEVGQALLQDYMEFVQEVQSDPN